MSTELLNPAAIMADHTGVHLCGGWLIETSKPCLTYLLAQQNVELQAAVADAWDEGAAARRMEDGSELPVDPNPYRVTVVSAP